MATVENDATCTTGSTGNSSKTCDEGGKTTNLIHKDSYNEMMLGGFSKAQVDREIDRLKVQHDIIAPIVERWIREYGRLKSGGLDTGDDTCDNDDKVDVENEELAWLDLGCGPGHEVDLICRTLEKFSHNKNDSKQKFHVIGMDINDQLLSQARANYGHLQEQNHERSIRATFQHGSATSIPLADKSLDCIFAKFVMQHIQGEDRIKVLSEMNRILKPGGRALIVDVDDSCGFFITPEPDNFQDMMKQFNDECKGGDRLVIRKLPTPLRQVGFNKVRLRTESIVGGIDEKHSFDDVLQTFYSWRFFTLREVHENEGTLDKVDALVGRLEEMTRNNDAIAMYPIFLVLAE